jgi:hypothetical protein
MVGDYKFTAEFDRTNLKVGEALLGGLPLGIAETMFVGGRRCGLLYNVSIRHARHLPSRIATSVRDLIL